MGQWTDSAAQAATSHPVCLAGFTLRVSPPAESNSPFVEFHLICKNCGRDIFRISSFPEIVTEPTTYFKVGDVLQSPPHSLECASCGRREIVFDPKVHGYDAVACNYCGYQGGEKEVVVPGEFKVTVTLAYNSELSELQESATKANVQVADLFDWIGIKGDGLDKGLSFEVDYECA